jgi:glycosyltransferase involved in cell wall biosynthesis
MTRVSIALAAYNGERHIREQLDSFAAQTRLPDQLIVCDDGSSDRTVSIVDEFAATAPFDVAVIRNPENFGYSNNFARAILQSDGDIIFLSDQDDVWFADKIATVLQTFDRHPAVQVVINDQVLTDEKLRHSGRTKLQNLKSTGKTSAGMIEGCCTALRSEWSRRLFPMPAEADDLVRTEDMSHDRWINELAMLVGRRVVIARPLQYFRRTGENTTSWLLSEPGRPKLRKIARERQRAAPLSAWHTRIAVLDAYEGFLRSHAVPGDKDAAFPKIAHERSSHQQRIRLAALPLWRRPTLVWTLWRTGGYTYFNGWLSAANDLLRPRSP